MRMSYPRAVAWIAENDDAGSDAGPDEIAGYLTTCLVADLSGKDAAEVARDVYRERVKTLGRIHTRLTQE